MNTFLTRKEEEMCFVTHTCKNSKLKPTDPNYCDNAFVDEDLTKVTNTPPTWKYCPECVEKGFKNPKKKKRVFTQEQIEAFKQRMAESRRLKKRGD